MTVFIDDARIPWNGWLMSHLFADTEDELHDFADRLGLKREWFQPRNDRPTRHYDVSEARREKALAMGAVALSYPHGVAELFAAEALSDD